MTTSAPGGISRADLDEDVRGINASMQIIRRTRGGSWPSEPVTPDSITSCWSWSAEDFPFRNPYYSNSEIPEQPADPS